MQPLATNLGVGTGTIMDLDVSGLVGRVLGTTVMMPAVAGFIGVAR